MAIFDLERIRFEAGLRGLEHHPIIGSTNDRALELIRRDANQEAALEFPFLILADLQSAGRGQFHRPWISEPGNLMCTLGCVAKNRQADTLLPLAVGLAVSEAIEIVTESVLVKLKWPNDIFIDDRKLGGILIEQVSERVAIGIGINVNRSVDLQQFEMHQAHEKRILKPISLQEASHQSVDLTQLTIEVVRQVLATMATMDLKRREILDQCHGRMIFRGQEIEVKLPSGELFVGPYRGLGDAGELIVETQGDLIAITSASAIRW